MSKYSRVQLIITCRTCEETITFSIYYGENNIWNNRDAAKMMRWREHVVSGHEVSVEYKFFPEEGK
jgi:hypothetical protein